jgi:hypothetical protein
MDRAHLVAYARRDWRRVAKHKERRWVGRARRLGPVESLALGDELRAQVWAARPDWPTRESRAVDLAAHRRLSELMQRVASVRS